MAVSESYVQRLPALGLVIARNIEGVPHDSLYYLSRNNERIGRFRSLKAAQAAWAAVIEETGWTPPKREVDAGELLRREDEMRENERFFEYWNHSHKHRARGGIHRNRR